MAREELQKVRKTGKVMTVEGRVVDIDEYGTLRDAGLEDYEDDVDLAEKPLSTSPTPGVRGRRTRRKSWPKISTSL